MFSTRFVEQDEDDQVLDEFEICINFFNNRSLTQSDIDDIDNRSQLEKLIQNQEIKDSGWRFDETN